MEYTYETKQRDKLMLEMSTLDALKQLDVIMDYNDEPISHEDVKEAQKEVGDSD